MRSVAILMTVHNRKVKTLLCLERLFSCFLTEECNFDVYLTNDGCTDGTPEEVKKHFPKVRILDGNGNLFWNRGMYKAWKEAAKKDYDYYIWLNDDTILEKDAIKQLIICSDKYQNQRIVVGSTCATGNPQQITYGGRVGKEKLVKPSSTPLPCDYFNGNIVLIPRQVYKTVGMNDPRFRHAIGDYEYGKRAGRQGIISMVAPGILGECNRHESLPAWCDPKVKFTKRWKHFRSPLGRSPEEIFYYERKYDGFFLACFHYLTGHVRVLFPNLWKLKNTKV